MNGKLLKCLGDLDSGLSWEAIGHQCEKFKYVCCYILWKNVRMVDPVELNPEHHGWNKDTANRCMIPTTLPPEVLLAPEYQNFYSHTNFLQLHKIFTATFQSLTQ